MRVLAGWQVLGGGLQSTVVPAQYGAGMKRYI